MYQYSTCDMAITTILYYLVSIITHIRKIYINHLQSEILTLNLPCAPADSALVLVLKIVPSSMPFMRADLRKCPFLDQSLSGYCAVKRQMVHLSKLRF